jgi:hypothetical protein
MIGVLPKLIPGGRREGPRMRRLSPARLDYGGVRVLAQPDWRDDSEKGLFGDDARAD